MARCECGRVSHHCDTGGKLAFGKRLLRVCSSTEKVRGITIKILPVVIASLATYFARVKCCCGCDGYRPNKLGVGSDVRNRRRFRD